MIFFRQATPCTSKLVKMRYIFEYIFNVDLYEKPSYGLISDTKTHRKNFSFTTNFQKKKTEKHDRDKKNIEGMNFVFPTHFFSCKICI